MDNIIPVQVEHQQPQCSRLEQFLRRRMQIEKKQAIERKKLAKAQHVARRIAQYNRRRRILSQRLAIVEKL